MVKTYIHTKGVERFGVSDGKKIIILKKGVNKRNS